jgi:hypothetical protein
MSDEIKSIWDLDYLYSPDPYSDIFRGHSENLYYANSLWS